MLSSELWLASFFHYIFILHTTFHSLFLIISFIIFCSFSLLVFDVFNISHYYYAIIIYRFIFRYLPSSFCPLFSRFSFSFQVSSARQAQSSAAFFRHFAGPARPVFSFPFATPSFSVCQSSSFRHALAAFIQRKPACQPCCCSACLRAITVFILQHSYALLPYLPLFMPLHIARCCLLISGWLFTYFSSAVFMAGLPASRQAAPAGFRH